MSTRRKNTPQTPVEPSGATQAATTDASPPSEIEVLQAQLRARDELLGQVCNTLDSLRVAILKRYGA